MTGEQLDRAKLAKLMAMTTSDQDGEALNALRMANKLIAGAKLSWPEVLGFSSSTRPPGSTFRDKQHAYEAEQRRGETMGDRDFGFKARADARSREVEETLRRAQENFEKNREAEASDIAQHRIMLDEVLKRTLPSGKLEHFLSIQREHQRNGNITKTHRGQIERAWYSIDGWDRPLGEKNA